MSQKLEDIRVYQSDVDTVRANESEININIPGYRGDEPQIIRLITLYKYKRMCRDGFQEGIRRLNKIRRANFIVSWNSMTKLLEKGPYEFDLHCSKKESQKEKFSHSASGLRRRIHDFTIQKWQWCYILHIEGNCLDCFRVGSEEAAKRQLGHIEDYDVLTDEEKHYIHSFNRLHRKKIAKETKAMANAPRDTQRVLRGYLPAAQSAGPTYLLPVGNQPNARGVFEFGRSFVWRWSTIRSTIHRSFP